ncbi:MAG: hypothetical protein WCF68_03610 [Terriglobales bacterium]
MALFTCAWSFSQTTPAAPRSAAALELPVVMRQNVVAGKTPVGTKVQAKLSVATLVQGVVIPQDAVFSGEVTESAAKSGAEPSRLAIRMDSAQWKNGASPMTLALAPEVYLTAWYYPVAPLNQDVSSGVPDAAHDTRFGNVSGVYPGQRNPNSPPLSGSDRDDNRRIPEPPAPASDISKHRVAMKNVESTKDREGAVTLTCKQSNIKLDKTTTYVLAAADLQAAK